jgi:integrating conjugative element protein (TIGR03756 family)
MKIMHSSCQNRYRKPLLLLGLPVLMALGPPGLAADGATTSAATVLAGETINSAGLMSSAVAAFPACGRWQPTGICFYLVCSLFECHTEESIKYGHYNPDLVVSAYNSSSNDSISGNPWTEAKTITGSLSTGVAAALVQAAPSAGDFSHGKHQNMIFKEADALGHPAALVTTDSSPPLCPTDAAAFKPYFLSGLDAIGWRWQIPEQVYPQSVIPGVREVGRGLLYTWGNLYPRGGFTTQVDDAKSAAVVAQRVADIVTRTKQPHVYLSLNEGDDDSNQHVNGETMVWSPGPITENDATNGWWQMNVPVAEQSCEVFGSNDLVSATGWGGGKVARSGSYAFTLWRPYQCCSIEGIFLFSIGIPYPPS